MKKDGALFSALENLLINDQELFVRIGGDERIKEARKRREIFGEWSYMRSYVETLPGTGIRDLFELPDRPLGQLAQRFSSTAELLSMRGLADSPYSYPSRNCFELYDVAFELHAAYPYSRLYLCFHEAYGYFGVIRLSPIGPASHPFRFYPMVVTDQEGKIQGFNNRFLNHFPGRHAKPGDFFGEPLEKYVRPDPLRSMIGKEDEFGRLLKEPWREKVRIDFSRAGDRDVRRVLSGKGLERAKGCWAWAPSKKERGLLPVFPALNTIETDYLIEVDLTLKSGDLPSFILNGVKDTDELFPDYNGYLAGMDYYSPCFQIKKEGSLACRSARIRPIPPGRYRLTAVRRGFSIALFLDGKVMAAMRDPEPAAAGEAMLYLYCRKEGRVLLHHLEISTLPASPGMQEGFNEVRFDTAEENAFCFMPLVDVIQPYGERFYYVFAFFNVTSFKRNIVFLQKAHDSLTAERDRYKALVMGKTEKEADFVGAARSVLELRREAEQVAPAPVTVLLEGETGTGKEVLARYMHSLGPRKKGPFIKVDCASIPETLLESELFGVEKGAFTGANESRPGRLEAAASGTLFLDELSNLNAATQAKLLNFLQDFTLERLGGTKKITVDTRIIGATNKPLKELVDKGLFRADLYYRISAVRFSMPPLRERREDIAALCTHFLKLYNSRYNRSIKGFAPAAYRELMAHDWPGNVRELENIVQKAVLFCDGDAIEPRHLSLPAPGGKKGGEELNIPIGRSRALTREHIMGLLKRNNNIVAWAAKEARVSTVTMFRKIKRFGIKVER